MILQEVGVALEVNHQEVGVVLVLQLGIIFKEIDVLEISSSRC
jgi:hypothetical protein